MKYLKTYEAWLDTRLDPDAEMIDHIRSNDVVDAEDEEETETEEQK